MLDMIIDNKIKISTHHQNLPNIENDWWKKIDEEELLVEHQNMRAFTFADCQLK